MHTHRVALGIVPGVEQMRAAGHNPDDITEEALRAAAHMAVHMLYPSASECHIRILTTSARWQWEAVLREVGAVEGPARDAVIAAWEPGRPVAIVITDVATPSHTKTGRLN